MPTSLPSQISPILSIVMALSPRSVLDVGAGFGKYGVLCREYLDVLAGTAEDAPYPPPRRTKLDCIEASAKYVSPLHRYIYDSIHIGDALDVLPTLASDSYDLALVVDVLEHFSPKDAAPFMSLVLNVSRVALVATPKWESFQGRLFGNEYERHRSKWTARSLKSLASAHLLLRTRAASSHIVILSNEEDRLVHLYRQVGRARRLSMWLRHRTAILEWLHLRRPLRRLFRREASAKTGQGD